MPINVSVSSNVEVKIRIHVLHNTIVEFVAAFGVSGDDFKKVLRKGIIEDQLIKKIWIRYYDSQQEIVGEIKLEIDWEKHEILSRDADGREFKLDKGKSVAQQIASWSNRIIKHMSNVRSRFKVKKVEIKYSYRDIIYSDPQKLGDARKKLGLSLSTEDEKWSKQKEEFDFYASLTPTNLPELNIEIQNNKSD